MKIRYMVLFYVLLALISTSVFAQVKSDVVPKNLDQSFAPTPSLYQDRVYNDNLNIKSGILGYTFTDFEEATFPPVGWTLEFSGTQYWTRETTCSGYGFGAAAAKFNFWSASTGTTQAIVSPTFPPAIAGDSLKFDLAHAPYSATADDKLKIEYSLDGGTNWIEIITLHGADGAGNDLNTTAKITVSFTPTADQWGTRTYGLPVGANRIKLTAISGYGNNLFVDNIKVGTPPANDVGLFSFDISTDQLPGTIVPKATVKNFGSATNTFTVKMTIGTYQSTKTVTSLSPNTTAQVLFDNWAAPLGVHVVKVYTQLAGDVNAMNDTLTTMVNVSNSTWMTGGTIPISTYMGTGASVKINDTLYVYSMGGNTTPAGNTGVARYNVNSNTWTTMAPLPISRVVFTAASIGTTIYTFGGSDGTNYGTQVFKYNALTNTWTPGPDLPTTLGWGKAAAYQDSLIYIVTGLINSTTYTNNVWVFNVNTQTFRAATPLPDAVFGGAVAIFGNKIVYVGGANAGGIVGTTHVGTISQTDRSQITWAAGTAYPPGTNYRWDGGTFGSKGIIVAGGSPTSDWATPRNLAYLYNPDTDTWMQLANKPTAILGAPVGFGSVGNNVYYVMASGYTGSGTFTGTEMFTDIDLVPVELTTFKANTTTNGTLLTWQTATEKNNSGFSIERKSGNNPFVQVGFVKGNGTTTEVSNYSFVDKTTSGNYTYRLRQVDFDGQSAYSQEVEVNIVVPKVFNLAQNYPNPFNPSTKITFEVPVQSNVKLNIYNVMGELVKTLVNEVKSEGSYELSFDASTLTSGVYIYSIEANSIDGKENFKSIKKMSFIK